MAFLEVSALAGQNIDLAFKTIITRKYDIINQPEIHEELQALEDRHSALELYQWLAIRFPRFFVDAEIAEEQAAICSDLIERGLAGMTERDFKTGSRRRDTPIKKAKAEKQKAKVRRDEVKAAKKEAKRRKTNRKAERKAWRSARAQCAL